MHSPVTWKTVLPPLRSFTTTLSIRQLLLVLKNSSSPQVFVALPVKRKYSPAMQAVQLPVLSLISQPQSTPQPVSSDGPVGRSGGAIWSSPHASRSRITIGPP